MAMEEKYDFLFKVILIGDTAVGKTSIIRRYTDDIFTSISTIGLNICNKTLNIDGSAIKLQIWDTAGKERHRTMPQSYYMNADAIILVYDINYEDSFGNCLRWWLQAVDKYEYESDMSVYKILVGNKSDRSNPDREVPTCRGSELAQIHHMPFLETSAKSGDNIDKLFEQLARTLKDTHMQKGVQGIKSTIQVKKEKNSGGGSYKK